MSQITLNAKTVSNVALAGRTAQLAADGTSGALGAAAGYGTARFVGGRIAGAAVVPAVSSAMAGLALPAGVIAAAPIAAGVLVGVGVAYGARWLMDKAFGNTTVVTAEELKKADASIDAAAAAVAGEVKAAEPVVEAMADVVQTGAAIHSQGTATLVRVAG